MSKWFYEKSGAPAGPFSDCEMRELYESSVLRPHTRIRRDGATNWVELEKAGLDLSEAAHKGRPVTPPEHPPRRNGLSGAFPPPADGHGPHFTAHGGRIEFHAPCRTRSMHGLNLLALILLLALACGALYLWMFD